MQKTKIIGKNQLEKNMFEWSGDGCTHIAAVFVSGFYQCPVYYYPNRGGRDLEHPSFVLCIDLKPGRASLAHWVRRAVAALLNLDQ